MSNTNKKNNSVNTVKKEDQEQTVPTEKIVPIETPVVTDESTKDDTVRAIEKFRESNAGPNLRSSSDVKTGTIKLHACGGAGINLGSEIAAICNSYGAGFAGFDIHCLDTADANVIKHNVPVGNYTLTKTTNVGGREINGSGGLRATNAVHSKQMVQDYINKNRYVQIKTGEYHMIVTSGSGGSGGPIAVHLANELLGNNIPVFVFVIGDSTTGLYAEHTARTFADLNKVAVKHGKLLPVVYMDNNSRDTKMTDEEKLMNVNSNLISAAGTMALFLSGDNLELDHQDMINFLDQSIYKDKYNIGSGIYGISMVVGKDTNLHGGTPIGVRTLTTDGIASDCALENILHRKVGYIKSDNAIKRMGTRLPIHIVLTGGIFSAHADDLLKVQATSKDIARKIANDSDKLADMFDDDEIGL